ncbi:hypothetical protein C7212DRAFT_284620 [Tuber magnatum]|uniref:C2H2-type domain-containing protein n=1 Tax=Tuber magnatum TaxID=42249 RepID=A0A317SGC4_9PEZI|nr:hypothetical protein C7212DRAFT_284620 [Tuber magnatum]
MSYAPKRKTDGGSDRPTKLATRPRQPAFHNLREKYPTVEKLEEHLKSLSRPAVEALILSGAFPEAASDLRHCVYCHKTFHRLANRGGCAVTHFIEEPYEFGDESETQEFLCCGARICYSEIEEHEDDPADMYPYCYQGRHWEVEITTDDEREALKQNEADEMIPDDDPPRRGSRPIWWRGWRENGMSCEKMKCREVQR